MFKLLKKLAIVVSISFLTITTSSYADESFVTLDEQLKGIISQNPQARSVMALYNFVEKDSKSIDIYRVTPSEGEEFIPQEKLSRTLYRRFIENGFLPVIAILETNKTFLESQQKAAKK